MRWSTDRPYSPWPSDYDAWNPNIESHVRVSAGSPLTRCPGRYIDVQRSAVFLQLKDLLERFVKRREFLLDSESLAIVAK